MFSMADLKKEYCRLCQSAITDENFTIMENFTRDMLDLLLLKLNFDDTNVMCGSCSAKLFAAFEFKSACLYTNNTLKAYGDCEEGLVLDIKDVYMKEIENKQLVNVSGHQKVCRLCIDLIIGEFVSAQEVDPVALRNYIPEINFNLTRDPHICKVCSDSLHEHADFVESCLKSQGDLKSNNDSEVIKEESTVPPIDVYVKQEDVIKIEAEGDEEETEALIKTEELLLKSEEFGDNSGVRGWNVSKIQKEHNDLALPHLISGDTSEVRMYKCDECDYQTKYMKYLPFHQLKHRDTSQVQMYKCDDCDYQTKYKRYLPYHQLKHRDISELRVHKCEKCDYETRNRCRLIFHRLRHRDPSEVRMHKCKHCGHQARYKSSLARHLLTHCDPSEVELYKCDDCDFQTKYKHGLTGHRLLHKDTETFKCTECGYQTRYKASLKVHQVRHKDSSETGIYKCTDCDYQSKMKRYLSRHRLIHKDVSEVQMHKCDECDYQAKRKWMLTHHQLRHRKMSEVQVYKCDECDFQTKRKMTLARHVKRHRESAKMQK